MFALLAGLILAADPSAWSRQEAQHLTSLRQVTFNFVRAGEGYFAPDGRQIIFQAEEKDTGNPFYQIFVMDLATGRFRRISPGIGKTTCSFFRPDGKKVIFASSHLDPNARQHQTEEYRQRKRTGAWGGAVPIAGTSIPTWTSSRPTRTDRTCAA